MPDYTRRIESLHGPYGLLRRLDPARIDGLLYDTAVEVSGWVEAEIFRRAPQDKGNLKRSIKARVERIPGVGVKIIVESDPSIAPYAAAVDQGSGLWGPSHAPITAKNPSGMRFFWQHLGMKSIWGAPRTQVGKRMCLMEVRGQMGQKFFERGWRAAMRQARAEFGHLLRKI